MDSPLRELRARQAQLAAQRATHEQNRKKLLETTATVWCGDIRPTRCISCNAAIPSTYRPGDEFPCGH